MSGANSFSLRHMQTNKWSAHPAGIGSPEEQFCRHSHHLSLDQLTQITIVDFGKRELLEKIFDFLQIPHVTPLGFSQQCEAPAEPPRASLLCCRMLGMLSHLQCGGDSPRAPRGVA